MKRPMTCIEIIGLKSHLHQTVALLQQVGCVHIESINAFSDVTVRPLAIDASILRRQEELSLLIAELEGELSLLGGATQHVLPPSAIDERDIRSGLATLSPQIVALTTQREALKAEQESLPRYEATLLKLLPSLPQTAYQEEKSVIGLLISRSHLEALEVIQQEVTQLTDGGTEFVERNVDDTTRALLMIVPTDCTPRIELLLGKKDVTRLRLPQQIEKGSLDATLTALQARMRELPQKMAAIDQQMVHLGGLWRERLTIWCHYLHDQFDAYAVLTNFGETEHTFVVMGWVPRGGCEALKTQLQQVLGNQLVISEKPITAETQALVPVALHNPAIVQPFESLVKIQSIPRSDGIDPTTLMALFMPIFFGMMLGDIAYGLILLGLTLWLLRRVGSGTLRDVLKVLAIGSVWSIAFGFLFGELFGTLGEAIGLHPILFDRADGDHIMSLMMLTLAIGAGHLSLGLLLGLIEAIKAKSRSHIMERGGMLIGLMGVFLMVAVLVELLPTGFMTPGMAVLILGIVILSTSMGWIGILMGTIEFMGVISNLLSYLRIAAIGLASVFLAKVANDLGGIAGNIIVGFVIAALFHALNIALGAFSPTIQSLRLHYVEFFPKFYQGGGRLYTPFRSRFTSTA